MNMINLSLSYVRVIVFYPWHRLWNTGWVQIHYPPALTPQDYRHVLLCLAPHPFKSLKSLSRGQVWWAIVVILVFWRLRQEGCQKFEVSLGYRVSFRLAWVTSLSNLPPPENLINLPFFLKNNFKSKWYLLLWSRDDKSSFAYKLILMKILVKITYLSNHTMFGAWGIISLSHGHNCLRTLRPISGELMPGPLNSQPRLCPRAPMACVLWLLLLCWNTMTKSKIRRKEFVWLTLP